MNLARHAAVLWRFRPVAIIGIGLGVLLAIMASYQVTLSGGPSLTPRGVEEWTATSSILVTQPGFPEGRVTLPTDQVDNARTTSGQPASGANSAPKDQVEFADPARLASLADLYSKFLVSDQVRARAPQHPARALISASPFAASQGGLILPVIQMQAKADTAPGAEKLNRDMFKALGDVLAEQQRSNHISVSRRVELQMLDAPDKPILTAGRKHTMAILVFLMCLIGTVAVAHLLAGVRDRRDVRALATVPAWTDGGMGAEPRAPREVRRDVRPAIDEDVRDEPFPATDGPGLQGGWLRR